MRIWTVFPFLAGLASAPAMAADLTITLRAEVAVRCQVLAIEPLDLAEGRLRVDTECNSAYYQLRLIDPAVTASPRALATGDGIARPIAGGAAISPDRPGRHSIEFDFGEDIATGTPLVAQITTI